MLVFVVITRRPPRSTRTDPLVPNTSLFRAVVGDTTLAEVKKELNATLGQWQAPATPKPEKNFDVAIPKPQPRILLVDRPKSPQSIIMAGKILGVKGGDDLEILRAANEEIGRAHV